MTVPENLKIPRKVTLDKYGITLEEWLAILEKQGYVCPICKKFPTSGRLYIEHEHIVGWKKLPPDERKKFIRGACCFICNYRNYPNVLVDASHLSRKFRKIGNNLVLWNHGDMAKQNAYSLIQREARKEFGETKYAEIHSGHFHSQQTVEKDGVIIRYLPTTTPTDVWHYENGYTGNTESTTSFLWDKNLGLREIWYSNL